MSDAVDRFAKHICRFLDTVPDMPKNLPLVFTVEVKKIKDGSYELQNPRLEGKKEGLILPVTSH